VSHGVLSGRVTILYSRLIRWSGFAAMVAGALLLIAELLELLPAFDDLPFSELALTSIFTFQLTLYLIGLMVLAVGLVGLYAHQSEAAGPLGLVGFLSAFIGTVFFSGFFWANIFVAPALAIGAPEFLDQGGRFPGFRLSLVIYAVGWMLFGLASLKARGYPRAPVIALVIGAALDLLGAPLSGLVIDAAFIWLGLSLFSERSYLVSRGAYET
jgi:hypothetical protein